MANSGINVLILHSTVAGRQPRELISGQLAINEADGRLFYRNGDGGVSYGDILSRQDVDKIARTVFASILPNGSQSQSGIVRLATAAEALALTSNVLAVTPSGLAAVKESILSTIYGGAPEELLDTIKEIGDAINNDADFYDTMLGLIGAKEATANKGVANGYASLDASGFVPVSELGHLDTNAYIPRATAAEVLALTSGKGIDTDSVKGANAYVTGAFVSGNPTPDFTAARNITYTLTGNSTFKFPAVALTPVVGMSGVIEFVQDGTGGKTLGYDVPGSSGYIFDDGTVIAIDSGANRKTKVGYHIRSTTIVELYLMGKGVR